MKLIPRVWMRTVHPMDMRQLEQKPRLVYDRERGVFLRGGEQERVNRFCQPAGACNAHCKAVGRCEGDLLDDEEMCNV